MFGIIKAALGFFFLGSGAASQGGITDLYAGRKGEAEEQKKSKTGRMGIVCYGGGFQPC